MRRRRLSLGMRSHVTPVQRTGGLSVTDIRLDALAELGGILYREQSPTTILHHQLDGASVSEEIERPAFRIELCEVQPRVPLRSYLTGSDFAERIDQGRIPGDEKAKLAIIYLQDLPEPSMAGIQNECRYGDYSADTSENTFHEVVQVLRQVCPEKRWDAEKHWRKGEPSWQPTEAERLLIDSFETPVRRPSLDAAQRRVYSGKKKRHTLKTQVVTDGNGEVLEIDPGHRGPTHDRTLYTHSGVAERYPDCAKYADLGYRGEKEMHLPHRKPKGGELTPEQREANRQHAAVRVPVEHGIRRLKSFRILREDYRLALGRFPQIAYVVVGLVHLVRIVGAASS